MLRKRQFQSASVNNSAGIASRLSRRSTSARMLAAIAACVSFLLLSRIDARAGDDIGWILQNPTKAFTETADLSSITGGGTGTPYGAITAFTTTPGQQFHVFYVDAGSSHVHQLYDDRTGQQPWSDQDITAMASGPNASPYGISGFSVGNSQYVFYVDTAGYVHMLSYVNNWTDQDITLLGGGVFAAPPVLAFATKPNNQFHVYYQDSSTLHLHQLFFDGTSWSDSDLTSITGAYCYSQWMSGFAVGNYQHIFCPGYGTKTANLDMLHIYYNQSTWVYEDVTFQGGGSETPMNLGTGVAAFKVPRQSQLEAFAITDDTHLQRYTRIVNPLQWIDYDLSNGIGAPTNSNFGGMTAFVTSDGHYHIYYAPGDVYHISYDGLVWTVEDITVSQFFPPDLNSGMAGFATGLYTHVFYMIR